jgi:hypothetical protein
MQKTIQRNLYKEKKKQISSCPKKKRINNWGNSKKEEDEYFEECRNTKFLFEKEKHDYLKSVDNKKLELEERRLELEASTSILKQEQIKLEYKQLELDNELSKSKKEQIVMQTNLEKSKLSLNNAEIYKARLSIKKDDPTVTNEFLDTILPFL